MFTLPALTTTTLSPQSTCGVNCGLCLPRSRLATTTARRPRTTPSASISTQPFVTSDGLREGVLLSIFLQVSVVQKARVMAAGRLPVKGISVVVTYYHTSFGDPRAAF